MSIKYLNSAFEADIGDVTQKFLLVAIADEADEEGISAPSLTKLMERINIKNKTNLINALNKLIEKGWITKVSNEYVSPHKLKRPNQNCYQVHLHPPVLIQHQYRNSTSADTAPVPEQHQSINGENTKVLAKSGCPMGGFPENSEDSKKENKEKGTQKEKRENLKEKEKNPILRIGQKEKKKSPSKTFELTAELLDWGERQPPCWTQAEMHQHADFFRDYLQSTAKPYKDLPAAFRNCVRQNWTRLRQPGAGGRLRTFQDENAERTEQAKQNFLKMIGEPLNDDEIKYLT